MTDSNLVQVLENFKKDNFDIRELVKFVNNVPRLAMLYKNCVNDFLKILENHKDLIIRFSNDINNHFESYTKEEADIINTITNNHLQFFYILYCVNNGEDIIDTENEIFRNFAIYFSLDNEELESLIDYIIRFGVYANPAAAIIEDIRLTPMEKRVLQCVNQNMNRDAIAEYLIMTPNTVDTHKKNITNKIKDKNIEWLSNYRGDERLRMFAGMYFV